MNFNYKIWLESQNVPCYIRFILKFNKIKNYFKYLIFTNQQTGIREGGRNGI